MWCLKHFQDPFTTLIYGGVISESRWDSSVENAPYVPVRQLCRVFIAYLLVFPPLRGIYDDLYRFIICYPVSLSWFIFLRPNDIRRREHRARISVPFDTCMHVIERYYYHLWFAKRIQTVLTFMGNAKRPHKSVRFDIIEI